MEGYADIHQIERSLEAYAYGSYGEIFSFRLSEWLTYGLTGIVTGRLCHIAADYDWGRIV